MTNNRPNVTDDRIIQILEWEAVYDNLTEKDRSYGKVAELSGVSKNQIKSGMASLRKWREKYPEDARLFGSAIPPGYLEPKEAKKMNLPKRKKIRRYIVTSAQNNTEVFKPFLENLEAYADFLGAELMIGTYTYSHNSTSAFDVKKGTNKHDDYVYWDDSVVPYISDDRYELANGLVWCGDWNIKPTVVDPVSNLDSFNGKNSNIFPHAKIRQKAIATQKDDPVKFNMTTGTVTKMNYVQMKAGMKAEFDHIFGALLIEVDNEGNWLHRQLIADSNDGSFYDLKNFVSNREIEETNQTPCIIHGDIHGVQFNSDIPITEINEYFKPEWQVMHDILDFKARNHHDNGNFSKQFRKYFHVQDSVQQEIWKTASLLEEIAKSAEKTYVAYSNHDDQIERWLNDPNYNFKKDYVNALYYVTLMKKNLEMISSGHQFSIFEWAMREFITDSSSIAFQQNVDESLIICGIEVGKHGHIGSSGSRGSLNQFANFGQKIVTGHFHKSEINRGAWSVGVYGNLDMGYNIGNSNWSHSFCIVHPNGKRQLLEIKMIKGKMTWMM